MDEILTPEQWYELQFRLKQQYPELADTDMPYYESLEQDMLEMVAYSLNKTKKIMQEILAKHNHLSPLKNYWRYGRKNHVRQYAEGT